MVKKASKGTGGANETPGPLKNISILLVEPRGAGNIGSTARAMANTGLGDLRLVNPCEYNNDEGLSMACNAHDILLSAHEYPSIKEAIRDTPIVVGTTRRLGRERVPVYNLDMAVPMIYSLAARNKVSILFGREDKGLKNDEIRSCGILLEIPTHPGYPSLNLAQAVMLVSYGLYSAAVAEDPPPPTVKSAPRKETEEMFVHMEEALKTLGYGAEGGEYLLKAIMRTMRRLYGRTALMQKEVNMLRGIFSQIQARVR